MTNNFSFDQFYKDLRTLAESAYPKRCANCGRIYETADEFLAQTQLIAPEHSGLKSSTDDDGITIVEVFRNCVCGSTLMDFFSDRRDLSSTGHSCREKFSKLLESLVIQGLDHAVARTELLKVLHGETSEILKQFQSHHSIK